MENDGKGKKRKRGRHVAFAEEAESVVDGRKVPVGGTRRSRYRRVRQLREDLSDSEEYVSDDGEGAALVSEKRHFAAEFPFVPWPSNFSETNLDEEKLAEYSACGLFEGMLFFVSVQGARDDEALRKVVAEHGGTVLEETCLLQYADGGEYVPFTARRECDRTMFEEREFYVGNSDELDVEEMDEMDEHDGLSPVKKKLKVKRRSEMRKESRKLSFFRAVPSRKVRLLLLSDFPKNDFLHTFFALHRLPVLHVNYVHHSVLHGNALNWRPYALPWGPPKSFYGASCQPISRRFVYPTECFVDGSIMPDERMHLFADLRMRVVSTCEVCAKLWHRVCTDLGARDVVCMKMPRGALDVLRRVPAHPLESRTLTSRNPILLSMFQVVDIYINSCTDPKHKIPREEPPVELGKESSAEKPVNVCLTQNWVLMCVLKGFKPPLENYLIALH